MTNCHYSKFLTWSLEVSASAAVGIDCFVTDGAFEGLQLGSMVRTVGSSSRCGLRMSLWQGHLVCYYCFERCLCDGLPLLHFQYYYLKMLDDPASATAYRRVPSLTWIFSSFVARREARAARTTGCSASDGAADGCAAQQYCIWPIKAANRTSVAICGGDGDSCAGFRLRCAAA